MKIKSFHCFGGQCTDRAPEWYYAGTILSGMDTVAEKDDKGLRIRIDPDGRSCETGMSVGAEWKLGAVREPARTRVAGVDVPA